jgi:membrane-anchored protein YejM (alkaline phosphatase superfamily)
LIKNRYVNSNHHLDQQFGRIIDSLRADGLLENTIVIITGDHGEEFMENGRWGHNSTFSEQQIRVPLIVYLPGRQPSVQTTMTSHMDLPATVLTALAGEHDSSAYSSGANLMAADYDRDYAIISDWHGDAVATAGFKHILSSKARRGGMALTRSNDQPVANTEEAEIDEPLMRRYLSDTLRFSGMRAGAAAAATTAPGVPRS